MPYDNDNDIFPYNTGDNSMISSDTGQGNGQDSQTYVCSTSVTCSSIHQQPNNNKQIEDYFMGKPHFHLKKNVTTIYRVWNFWCYKGIDSVLFLALSAKTQKLCSFLSYFPKFSIKRLKRSRKFGKSHMNSCYFLTPNSATSVLGASTM